MTIVMLVTYIGVGIMEMMKGFQMIIQRDLHGGVYPAGGAFDNNQFNRVDSSNTQTLNGEGINPIFLSSFTHFALAEAGLDLGVGVDARALLEAGISLSMDKVTDFSGSLTTTDEDDETIDYAATSADISDYIARVLAEYDAASGNDAKLAIVIREWYIASWGNGIEPYNMYRRTGYPDTTNWCCTSRPIPKIFQISGIGSEHES